MSFKDQISTDTATVFMNDKEFAEQITYIARSGDSIVINAIVIRNRIEPSVQNTMRSVRKHCEVYIANHADSGVEAVDIGNDTISFPEYPGQDVSDWVVEEIIEFDKGIWRLLVGK